MNTGDRKRSLPGRIVRIALILVSILVVGSAGIYLWAWLSTGTSLVARGIIWSEAKADDWKRFPSRVIHASPQPQFFKDGGATAPTGLTFAGQPLATYLEETNTTAFLVLHGDELVYEGYFHGSSREATQASLSATKSFASTLVGIAIDEGYIGGLDDSIITYIPELSSRDPRYADVTIRHLLTMSSGLRFVRDDSNPFSDDFITYFSPDLRTAALEAKISEAPGLSFHYNDYNPLLIGMALERATSMPVSAYLETRLWQRMGAEGDGSWDLDSEHSAFEKMSVGINGRAVDFAKLGWLFLNEGKNGERQVVPAAWIEEATRVDSTTDPADFYQYYWWLDLEHNAYYAEGNFCQYIYVYPDADLVMVRHGRDCGGGWFSDQLGDMAEGLVEQLGL